MHSCQGISVLCTKQFSFTSDAYVVVVLSFYDHGKQLRSCPDGQLT